MGTEQTRARLRGDPVDELAAVWKRRGLGKAGELEEAAREIRLIYTHIVSGVMCRAVDLHGVRGQARPFPEWLAIAKRDRYTPWATEMGARLPIIIDWLIEEIPLRQIDRDRRQRNGAAVDTIELALIRYAEISGRRGRVVRKSFLTGRGR